MTILQPPVIETIYDRMYNANRKAVATTAMSILNRLQDMPADIQLAAAGAIMLCMTRRFGVEPANVLNCTDNLIKDARMYDDATFQGIFEYMKHEL